jgi:Asp-tRNA(Asn)/Glu-tRNA(Gln) amidotransferase A subunit family amidase
VADLSTRGPEGLNLLTATELAQKIANRELTSEAVVRDCLDRIEARDADIMAWKHINTDAALLQAKALDATSPIGPLHGVPVGIKDILDTSDMPTEYGSSLFQGHQPQADCHTVAALRKAGAVILGKTVTTEFASPYPTFTLNPHDLKSTPGVSSSGSAAAVADFMVPLSNGTQTGGSVIRPAALCGIYGYKASLHELDPSGIQMWKPNIDTLGNFARSLEDIALMRAALRNEPQRPLSLGNDHSPRIGICRTGQWPAAGPENIRMFEIISNMLEEIGIEVEEITFPDQFEDVLAAHMVVVGADSMNAFPNSVTSQIGMVNPWTRARHAEAQKLTEKDISDAHRIAAVARKELDAVFEKFDILLTPCAEGEATPDHTAMSPPSFNSLWTLMHVPCVSLPAFVGPNDMPVGLQVIGHLNNDHRTLALSSWLEKQIEDSLGPLPAMFT